MIWLAKMFSDASGSSSTCAISDCSAFGLTIRYWRSTRSRYLFLYLVWISWYSAIRSTNLRVSVPCMFARIRASEEPSFRLAKSLFSWSIPLSRERTFCAQSFVSFISCSSRALSFVCSPEMAMRHSPWFCSTSLTLCRIVAITFFTSFTSSKNDAMNADCCRRRPRLEVAGAVAGAAHPLEVGQAVVHLEVRVRNCARTRRGGARGVHASAPRPCNGKRIPVRATARSDLGRLPPQPLTDVPLNPAQLDGRRPTC